MAENQFTDLELKALDKWLGRAKSLVAKDCVVGSVKSKKVYLGKITDELFKSLHISDDQKRLLLGNTDRFCKFHGINPLAIRGEIDSRLEEIIAITGQEIENEETPWVNVIKRVRELTDKYGMKLKIDFQFPNYVKFQMKLEGVSSKWAKVSIPKRVGKEPNLTSIDSAIAELLPKSLLKAMSDKAAELSILHFPEYEPIIKEVEPRIETCYYTETTHLIVRTVDGDYDCRLRDDDKVDKTERIRAFVQAVFDRVKKLKEAKDIILNAFVPKGFKVSFEDYRSTSQDVISYKAVFGKNRLNLWNNFDLRKFTPSSIESFKEDAQTRAEILLRRYNEIKDYLDKTIPGEHVSWTLDCSETRLALRLNDTSSVKIFQSFEELATMNLGLESWVSEVLQNNSVKDKYAKIVEESISYIGFPWTIDINKEDNIIVTVTLPGLPKIAQRLTPNNLRAGLKELESKLLAKKKMLHL